MDSDKRKFDALYVYVRQRQHIREWRPLKCNVRPLQKFYKLIIGVLGLSIKIMFLNKTFTYPLLAVDKLQSTRDSQLQQRIL